MSPEEFSNQFDVLFNNITNNQAPGLNEYEKSVLLTKAQSEIVKNYFTANSKGNNVGQGFDDSAKRQIDFSNIICSGLGKKTQDKGVIDPRAIEYKLPGDMLFIINETVQYYETISWVEGVPTGNKFKGLRQVIPLRYDEYTRLMCKPFKEPVKNQAWRIMADKMTDGYMPLAEVLITTADWKKYGTSTSAGIKDANSFMLYVIRYVRRPKPIILTDLTNAGEDLSIDGKKDAMTCELSEQLHEEILQRAVELAKVAWTATGQDNYQAVIQAGQRSE